MRSLRALPAFIGLSVVLGSAAAQAQQPASAATPVGVYLDCRDQCDHDFIRTEITFVDWVRERAVADVHVLITAQPAGAGGRAYTVAFLGLRSFARRGDTLVYTAPPTATPDDRRRGMTNTIAVGLVQFAARRGGAASLRVTSAPAAAGPAMSASSRRDPWRAWVFGIRLNGETSGERAYSSNRINGRLSANRVTEAWKTNLGSEYSYRNDRATIQEFDSLGNVTSEDTYRNLQRDWDVELLQVKSISNHVSIGAYTEVASQTFRNQTLRVVGLTAVEYNIFPYTESTRRELSFRYGVGATAFRYADTTIFDEIRETLPSQMLEGSYRTRQPWGSANLSVEHRSYLHDLSKRATEINGNLDVRLFRGFGLGVGGGYDWIHDQIYLPKAEGSAVDVLLRRRALLTGYQYHLYAGVSYTFGSIFNNVVNPRF